MLRLSLTGQWLRFLNVRWFIWKPIVIRGTKYKRIKFISKRISKIIQRKIKNN